MAVHQQRTIALVSVFSHRSATLKDVAGGFGTAFEIGSSVPARVLQRAKGHLAQLPSPSLGYLAAQMEAAGHHVRICEVRRGEAGHDPLPYADLAVVLSSMVDASAEVEVLREYRRSGIRTATYGSYATARPEVYADAADVVVRGEVEQLGARLLDPALKGVVEAGFVMDLDTLPYPSWRRFPYKQYRYALLSRRGTTLPVSGVRGCAFGCGYCPFRVTSPFRQRDPDKVVAEVAHLVSTYGATGIAFRDPLFNLDEDRVRALAKGLAPLNVRFSGEMRADRLDEDLLAELHAAGLRSLEIGVESVNLKMLKDEKRNPPSQAQIERIVAAAHKLGVRVIANYMMGLPSDSAASIRETVKWAKKLNTFAVQFTVATPYPGTTLETAVKDRLVEIRPDRYTGWEPAFEHPTMTADELRKLREWAYVSYHARPRYVRHFAKQALRSLAD